MRTSRATGLIALALVTSLFLPSPAQAQAQAGQSDSGIGVGALGGIGFTSARGEGSEDISSGTGAIFGIWFGGNRNGRVGFLGELNYVAKRINDSEDSDTSLTTYYLEIPAVFRFNFGDLSNREGLIVYGLAGPVFDFRMSSKLVEDGVEIPEADLDNAFSAVEFGIMAGVGFEWARFGFEFRVNFGLNQLATDEAVEAEILPPAKTTSIQIVGKFRFN